jgi:hypothetical protein
VSNLIYSSGITTSEAIGAVTRIKADMYSTTVHDLSNVAHICDESQILHAAAGVCLSNFCCSLCDVQLSFRSDGRNSEKSSSSLVKVNIFCELASHLYDS